MRYAHLSPARLQAAVNRASLGPQPVGSESETVTNETLEGNHQQAGEAEPIESTSGCVGGAGRVRTAASQFCRLLP